VELNLAVIHEAIAARWPARECLAWRGRRWSWAEVTDRTRRLATVLREAGIGRHRTLDECELWESPHDQVALYLLNSNAYLEGMLGAYKARAAPFNVNFRYVAEELRYVLADAGTRAVLYHGRYADTLAEVLPQLPEVSLLLRVDDGSGEALLPGAVDYEAALAAASPATPEGCDPDDLYVLYTGGTTGAPKGVLWRQADFLVAALGVRRRDGSDFASLDELVAKAERGDRLRTLPAPPFMHGAAHWNALSTWTSGGTVVIQDQVDRLDPADVLDTAERERVTSMLIVGDAFARPLLDELHQRPRDLSSLRFLLTGGAILSPPVKAQLLHDLPGLQIVDVLGSSESGRQGVARDVAGARARKATFDASPTAAVLNDARDALLAPGSPEIGWLAQSGRVPRGYLGDPAKTRATFPEVAGRRWSVPGDRARLLADGSIELHGRESVTINSGGEKIFAEEVEAALKHHAAVYDALVVGRPSERWGQEVVAVVALRAGAPAPSLALEDELRATCAEHLARYKLPKAFRFVPAVSRSPSGKPDYGWARDVAARPGTEGGSSAPGVSPTSAA
jgi:acyl-CoA synthetase (AMP-forming)/AMP-acid ligase II